MAGTNIVLQTAEIALTGGAAKTCAQLIAPTNVRVVVKGWGVSFDGPDGTNAAAECVLAFHSTAGTGTAQSPVATDSDAVHTIQTAGNVNFSAEPTLGNVVDSQECNPARGFVIFFPEDARHVIGPADRMGITLTAAANVNARVKIYAEE